MRNAILAIALLCVLGACAEPGPPASRYDEHDYVTGSNLPRRGSTMPPDTQTVRKETLEDWQRARPGPMPTGSMGGMGR
jgi:hypothetical protein